MDVVAGVVAAEVMDVVAGVVAAEVMDVVAGVDPVIDETTGPVAGAPGGPWSTKYFFMIAAY